MHVGRAERLVEGCKAVPLRFDDDVLLYLHPGKQRQVQSKCRVLANLFLDETSILTLCPYPQTTLWFVKKHILRAKFVGLTRRQHQ